MEFLFGWGEVLESLRERGMRDRRVCVLLVLVRLSYGSVWVCAVVVPGSGAGFARTGLSLCESHGKRGDPRSW